MNNVIEANINKEFEESFLTYAKLTIVDRSLPDIMGMKPVHTRILWGMEKIGMKYNKPYKKAAMVVGEVMGKYHVHGDSSIYGAMVRLSDPNLLRYPLIDPQGNIGAIDGSGPAAMRYVEMRPSIYAELMLDGYKKNAVDMKQTYTEDGTLEPVILPGLFPNILVNGNEGIAVSTSCSFLPHNLREVCAAIVAQINNPEITTTGLMEFIKGPDFPLGGVVTNEKDLYDAYHYGVQTNTVKIQGDYSVKGQVITFTSIPYGTNTTKIKEQISKYGDELDGYISDFEDLTDHKGVKMIFTVPRGISTSNALALLFKRTDLQSTSAIRMNLVVGQGFEESVSLKKIINYYIEHQLNVIKRIATFDIESRNARKHIIDGLIVALANIDDIIKLIKASSNSSQARESLMERYSLTEIQAKAVLDTKLAKLTSLEVNDLKEELNSIISEIEDLEDIINNESRRKSNLITSIEKMSAQYGDDRRTVITTIDTSTTRAAAKQAKLPTPATPIKLGYSAINGTIKVVSGAAAGMEIISTKLNSTIAFFTKNGMAYKMPVESVTSTLQNIKTVLKIPVTDFIVGYVDVNTNSIVRQVTAQGMIKSSDASEYNSARAVQSIKLKAGDHVIAATAGGEGFVSIKTTERELSFSLSDITTTGRATQGLKAITLDKGDSIKSAEFISKEPKTLGRRAGKGTKIK